MTDVLLWWTKGPYLFQLSKWLQLGSRHSNAVQRMYNVEVFSCLQEQGVLSETCFRGCVYNQQTLKPQWVSTGWPQHMGHSQVWTITPHWSPNYPTQRALLVLVAFSQQGHFVFICFVFSSFGLWADACQFHSYLKLVSPFGSLIHLGPRGFQFLYSVRGDLKKCQKSVAFPEASQGSWTAWGEAVCWRRDPSSWRTLALSPIGSCGASYAPPKILHKTDTVLQSGRRLEHWKKH